MDPKVLEYIEFKSDGQVVMKSSEKELSGKWETYESGRVKIEFVGRLATLAEMCSYSRADETLNLDGCTLRGVLQRL